MEIGRMKIELNEIAVREVVAGYVDSAEKGCIGYGGKLNIRPAFQREFIYKDKQRDAVIESIRQGFPLNVMYWLKNDDGTFELLDGQQRTISICMYVHGAFSINSISFNNLTPDEKNQILDYKLMIYICSEGTDRDRLNWFEIINIAGIELTKQEVRNTIYIGAWLDDAKKYFSKTGCAAQSIAGKYLKGSAIRQDFLETALKWISARDKIKIEDYMNIHSHAPNCNELWLYFKKVIDWVQIIFPNYHGEMKGLDWGILYNQYGLKNYDTGELAKEIVRLMEDEDVTNNKGIYEYLLSGKDNKKEKLLSIRKFTPKMKRAAYEKQNHCCAKCGKNFPLEKMHADHIIPWSKGGRTIESNCQMLCENCNRIKSDV